MPYVHLANGDVESVTQEDLDDTYGAETPREFVRNGKRSAIIGIYPDDVDEPENDTDNEPEKDEERSDAE